MDDPIDRLRSLCLALPEVEERPSHGHPAWFVRGKRLFVTAGNVQDGRDAFWCAAPIGAQEDFVAGSPSRYFRPPYVGHRGWLGVYLDAGVDWVTIRHHVRDAYRVVAPRRLAAALDGA